MPGTYGAVRFNQMTCNRLYDFARRHKVPDILDPTEFHTTIIYSRKEIPFKALGRLDTMRTVYRSTFSWDLFGENKNTLVLKFKSPFLHERWAQAIKMGATYDFPEYHPHVSLSYAAEGFDIKSLPFPEFDLYIREEYVEELQDD